MAMMHNVIPTTAWGMPGGLEWVALAVLGLLIFGKRLPEVGRSVGKGIVEFKKGLSGIQDDIDGAGSSSDSSDKQPGQIENQSAKTIDTESDSEASPASKSV